MCIDVYKLNFNTNLDAFPLLCIADSLDKLDKAKYFISINLAIAYQQVKMAKGNTHKTVFLLIKISMSMFKVIWTI